ncbi:unnamed protein product [Prorocentrum cordatum]|uniref:PBZ-type domain-containing protein n=1 Tax=Prorocentrum cordatum TaxID=2364126 RepID=A0ABN9X5V4_9DINO|nr:unnamed protein product [Polarella glacialis]
MSSAPVASAPYRRKCRYGANCYRRSPGHVANYSHPGDPDWAMDSGPCIAGTAVYTDGRGSLLGVIEQAPGMVRFVAFVAGCACIFFALLRLVSFFSMLDPVTYILQVYILIFASVTMLFEASPDVIEMLGPFSKFQDLLIQNCPFLTTAFGRGLFYIFQGTLWFSLGNVNLLECVAALSLSAVGAIHIMVHYGCIPETTAEKTIGAIPS